MALKRKAKIGKPSKLDREMAELEAGLSPKAKALYEEILAIRASIGKVQFDVADLIREIREEDG